MLSVLFFDIKNKSHARRTIITFGSVIALSLFFVKEKSVIFGIIIISFIVIYKHVICTENEKICESCLSCNTMVEVTMLPAGQ